MLDSSPMPSNLPIPNRKLRSTLKSGVQSWVQAEKMVQIALVLPCAVLIGWGCGAWLDNRLHQSWMTLAGIALGSVAGMVSAIRMALAAVGNTKTEDDSGNETDQGSSGEDS